jgi:large subunit ribosomal protein L1
MAKLSKRMQEIRKKIQPGQAYAATAAFDLLRELSQVKFRESVDVSVNLGVDPRKSDQVVRGSTVLPNGTGKTVRVAVFTQGANAEAAREAGADVVGMEDLAEQVRAGNLNFDVVIASPDAMRVVGQLGQILGPRGLMPNPKVGTVTPDVATAVRNAKGGQVRYRTDKGGIIHCSIGAVDFESQALLENLDALLADLRKLKPSTSKGVYVRRVTVSSTMGPGVPIDPATLSVAVA